MPWEILRARSANPKAVKAFAVEEMMVLVQVPDQRQMGTLVDE